VTQEEREGSRQRDGGLSGLPRCEVRKEQGSWARLRLGRGKAAGLSGPQPREREKQANRGEDGPSGQKGEKIEFSIFFSFLFLLFQMQFK
jgi:hypothetical protein